MTRVQLRCSSRFKVAPAIVGFTGFHEALMDRDEAWCCCFYFNNTSDPVGSSARTFCSFRVIHPSSVFLSGSGVQQLLLDV